MAYFRTSLAISTSKYPELCRWAKSLPGRNGVLVEIIDQYYQKNVLQVPQETAEDKLDRIILMLEDGVVVKRASSTTNVEPVNEIIKQNILQQLTETEL